jgi:phosphoribosylformylglycinamidine synthase
VTQGRVAGRPPRIDLAEEAALHRLLVAAARDGLTRSAHDVATGGLFASVLESALPGGLGAHLLPELDVPPAQWLFSESPTRVVVSVRPADTVRFTGLCDEHGVGARVLGSVTAAPEIVCQGWFALALAELAARHERALPEALGVG